MKDILQGSCNCQSVKYQISGPINSFQYCFCSRCQKETGSAYGAKLFVKPEYFKWLQGEENIGVFDLPSAKYFRSAFCKTCGSSLPWLTKPSTSYVVPAGTLDDDPKVRPLQSIYNASKACWYESPEDLPAWDELPARK